MSPILGGRNLEEFQKVNLSRPLQLNLQYQIEQNTIRSIEQDSGILRIKIGEISYSNSVIITPGTIELWNPSTVAELTSADFNRLSEIPVEVVLLGSGLVLEFPNMALTTGLIDRNIGLEVMDSAAACRTYNILVGDGRSVAAALIL